MKLEEVQEILSANGKANTIWMMLAGKKVDLKDEVAVLKELGISDSKIIQMIQDFDTLSSMLTQAEPLEIVSEEILKPERPRGARYYLGVEGIIPEAFRSQFDSAVNSIQAGSILQFHAEPLGSLHSDIAIIDPSYLDYETESWVSLSVVTPLPYDDPVALRDAIVESIKDLLEPR